MAFVPPHLLCPREGASRHATFLRQRAIAPGGEEGEQTPIGEGYLLDDANYETNPLYDQAAAIGRVLVTPRRFANAKGLGRSRQHSEHRVAMIQRMKNPSSFIRDLLCDRRDVETRFANLSNFGGGLTHVPPWVRGRRVRPYVTAKILIRLARDRMLEKQRAA